MDNLLPENHEFWRTDAMPLHFLFEHRHSNPSRDEARRVHVNVLLQFLHGHVVDDVSRLCSLHHYALIVICQNFTKLEQV